MEMTPGFLARSIAGNDKDKIYVISEDLGTYVSLLAENGRVLRKNKKHVQLIMVKHVKKRKCSVSFNHRFNIRIKLVIVIKYLWKNRHCKAL